MLDAVLVLTLTLALGRIGLLFASQPIVRRRICIFTLVGCLLATPLSVLPDIPRLPLGLLNSTQLVTTYQSVDIGWIPTGGGGLPAAPPVETSQRQKQLPTWKLTAQWAFHSLTTLYLICVALLTARLLLGVILVRRYIATATPARGKLKCLWRQIAHNSCVQLKTSTTLPRPITAGFLYPVVLVPDSLANRPDQESLRAMLLHEFAHTRRRDTLACLLASMTHVVFFFHPLVWWTTHDLHRSQEILADSWAADKMGDAEKYVSRFLELTRSVQWTSRLLMPVAQAFRRHSEFYHRMKFVLANKEHTIEMRCRRGITLTATLIILAGIAAGAMTIGGKESLITPPHILETSQMETSGIRYLLTKRQPNGGWMTQYGPGVTASMIKILLRTGYSIDSPEIAPALAYLESSQQPDGGFYLVAHPTFNTAIVINTLTMINHPRINQRVERAKAFIQSMRQLSMQNAQSQQRVDNNSFYSAAYEVEALRNAGLPSSDPTVAAAFKDMTEAARASGERADSQRLPRYGSMTYAELKSMLYAGLSRDDPRVRGILACIQEYYTLENNPGDGSYRGQYYFYHSFAKAMRAYGQDIIVDARGERHDWKRELSAKLASLQRPDGSWVNTQAREYLEHDPVLVTVYCILALQEMRESGR